MKSKFNFGCLMEESMQIKLRDYAIQGKRTHKRFSQGKIVHVALQKIFAEIEREGLEFVFLLGKKTIDI